MANPVAIVGQTAALTVLKEGISLVHGIIEYRQQALQIELAREQMHRQADLHMADIEHEFAKDMQRLHELSVAFHHTLKRTTQETKSKAQLIKRLEKQLATTLQAIHSPELPTELRLAMNQTLQMMTEQQGLLIQAFVKESNGAVNAFAIFADNVRTSPRTFTDVR